MITASDVMTIVSRRRLSSADKIGPSAGTFVVVLLEFGPDKAMACREMQVHQVLCDIEVCEDCRRLHGMYENAKHAKK